MKKYLLPIAFTYLALITIGPYYIGRVQHNNAVMMVQNFGNDDSDYCNTFSTDGEIEDLLRVYGFNDVGVFDDPTTFDYYNAGIYAIQTF